MSQQLNKMQRARVQSILGAQGIIFCHLPEWEQIMLQNSRLKSCWISILNSICGLMVKLCEGFTLKSVLQLYGLISVCKNVLMGSEDELHIHKLVKTALRLEK